MEQPDLYFPYHTHVRFANNHALAGTPGIVTDHEVVGDGFHRIFHHVSIDNSQQKEFVEGRFLTRYVEPEPHLFIQILNLYAIDLQDHRVVDMNSNEFLNGYIRRGKHPRMIKPTEHTRACMTHTLRTAIKQVQWKILWPNHCPSCLGRGSFAYQGSRDEPGGSEPCSLCDGSELCPRCGQIIFPSYSEYDAWLACDDACPKCGWKRGKHHSDFMPEPGDCDCWESDAPKVFSLTEWFDIMRQDDTFSIFNKETTGYGRY